MRRIWSAAVVGLVCLVACSDGDKDAPACSIPGTYTMTAAPETQSSGCSALPPAAPTTVTVNSAGGGYSIEMQSLQGGCVATLVEACKIQAKCDFQATDALDPAQATGTLQFSWTFDAGGFKGINSGTIPKARSVPDGCTFTSNATAQRR